MSLVLAAKNGHKDQFNKLLAEGADPNDQAGERDPPLWYALAAYEKGSFGIEEISLIVSKGANTKYAHEEYGCHSSSSETCWQRAVSISLRKNDGALMVLFLKNGGDPNERVRESFGGMRTDGVRIYYPIHLAGPSVKVVAALLEAGANPNAVKIEDVSNERGFDQHREQTLLHSTDSFELSKLLLENGANPNIYGEWLEHRDSGVGNDEDPRGANFISSVICVPHRTTALHQALERKALNTVKLLIAHGASTSLPSFTDGIPTTTFDLCRGDELFQNALVLKFDPTFWVHYPPAWKAIILTLSLCLQHIRIILPKEVKHIIFTNILLVNQKVHPLPPQKKERQRWGGWVDFED